MEFEIVFDREEDGRWIAEIESRLEFSHTEPRELKRDQRWKHWRCVWWLTA